jgi:phage shock protein E
MAWMSQLLPQEAELAPLPLDREHVQLEAHDEAALLIDVRSYAEFMNGHLPGALCLPLPRLAQDVLHRVPDRETPVLLYCATGARAEQALSLLRQMGYHAVRNGGSAIDLARRRGLLVQQGL